MRLVCLWMVVFCAQFAVATDTARVQTTLQKKIDSLYKDAKYPGASLGFVLPDGSTGTATAGWADIEARKPMTADSVMLAGSVGKIFCAALALQLVEEGKLSLDQPISKWIGTEPWFPKLKSGDKMTLRMLLNHTTGIPRYVFKESFAAELVKDRKRKWKPEELVAFILDDELVNAPGSGFSYADTNYLVAGIVIEKVTGKTYYDLVHERLLKPHGFKNIIPTDTMIIKGLVPGYAADPGILGFAGKTMADGISKVNIQFEWTGGGYATTTAELARFGQMLYEGKFHKPATIAEMFKAVEAPQLRAHYGLGVILRERRGVRMVGHDGFMPGYLTRMVYFPDKNAGLAFQVNTTDRERNKPHPWAHFQALAQTFMDALDPVK